MGQHIARHLETHFGSELNGACKFFKGFERKTGTHWSELVAAIEQVPKSATPDVIKGAKLMFARFESWILAESWGKEISENVIWYVVRRLLSRCSWTISPHTIFAGPALSFAI